MVLALLIFLFEIYSATYTNAARRTERTSSSEITTPGNPCFQQPSSAACVVYIADKRGSSFGKVRALIARAQKLFSGETKSSAAHYSQIAVAVACLASRGILRPGPDEDCVACVSTCNAESRPEVCELYCTRAEQDNSTNSTRVENATSLTDTEYFINDKSTANIFKSIIVWSLVAIIIILAMIDACLLLLTYNGLLTFLRSRRLKDQHSLFIIFCSSILTLFYKFIIFNLH